MAIILLNGVASASVTKSSKSKRAAKGSRHTVNCSIFQTTTPAASQWSATTIKLQGSETNEDSIDGMVTVPQLAVGSTTHEISHAAFDYRIANVHYSIALDATLTLATGLNALSTTIGDYTITADKWGGFKVYVNAAGTVKVMFPAETMAYASDVLGQAAVDALPDRVANYVSMGKVIIEADNSTWTANTDDLVNGSDIERVLFADVSPSFTDLATHIFTADEITSKRAIFTVVDSPTSWVRLYASTITGTVEITASYSGTEGF